MAGIYIHIPFCKQACHYCDFHFSTSLKYKDLMIQSIKKELTLRQSELSNETIETIYFGGGTPSLLSDKELQGIIDHVTTHYSVSSNPEISLEANPDDLDRAYLQALSNTTINRLSIGIQSFVEQDLEFMNRAHSASEAKSCLESAKQYFDNITIDLIYGIPGLSDRLWRENLDQAFQFDIKHISSYALTVEPKTALASFIANGSSPNVDEEQSRNQFEILVDTTESQGFVHYEISNFGKKGYFSKHNTSYWKGVPYLGIGPSAHSFNGQKRSWNIANNVKYLKSLEANVLAMEVEQLSKKDQLNERIMTGLRTIWGISLDKIEEEFDPSFKTHIIQESRKFVNEGLLEINDNQLKTTQKGKFLADGIASELFMI